ncbi:MAG: MFS transporter [Pseudomonadota bacterium]
MEKNPVYSTYRWAMLLSVCFAIMSVYIDMIAIAPILGDVAKGLQVDMGAATNLMMGFVLATACVLIWGGVVVDKFGMTAATVLGLLCATLPATLMPMTGQNYGLVMIARLIQGASVGFIFAIIGPTVVLWFPPREHGLAGGIIIAFISVGSALGGLFSPMILAAGVSWQVAVCVLSVPGWGAVLLALIVMRRSPSPDVLAALAHAMQPSAEQITFGKAFRLPMTWIGGFVVFFNTWNLYCFLNLIPPYLAAPAPMGVGLGPVTAGQLALAGTIVGILSTIAGGSFFDKIAKGNQKPAVIGGFVLTALFAFPMTQPLVNGNMLLLIACLMLVGWGINFMGASINGFIAMNYPPGIVGRMVGWWFGFGTFGGALGLYLGGKTIDATGSFKTAIMLLSISASVGLVLDLFLKPCELSEKKH